MLRFLKDIGLLSRAALIALLVVLTIEAIFRIASAWQIRSNYGNYDRLEVRNIAAYQQLAGREFNQGALAAVPDRYQALREKYLRTPKFLGSDFEEKNTPTGNWKDYTSRYSIKKTGELVYEETYHFDRQERRFTMGVPERAKKEIMIIGAAEEFGQGLNEGETLATLLQKQFQDTSVHTYANGKWGVNDHLAALKQVQNYEINPYRQLGEKRKVIAFFFFHEYLLNRTQLSLSGYASHETWRREGAKWELPNGNLEYVGPFKDSEPPSRWRTLLADSGALRWLAFDYPSPSGPANIYLFLRLLREFHDELAKRLELEDFYIVVDGSNSDASRDRAEVLLGLGYKVLDLRDLSLGALTSNTQFIPVIEERSARANYLIANVVAHQIKVSHPDWE